MNKLFLFISFSLLLFTATAQTDDSPYRFSSTIYDSIKKDSNYWRYGISVTDLSFVGLYKEMLINNKGRVGFQRPISTKDSIAFIQTYHAVDAKTFILQKAKENQILIFNEAHSNARHRIFVTSLLKDLRKLGYTYFAAETFTNDSTFTTKGAPNFHTGYYTREPQFGNLVREAIRLNYILYPYEDTGVHHTTSKEREITEAKNIQQLLQKDPQAKIIIHCGFDHIVEDSIGGSWGKAMAGRLKEFTGIDPYTIHQNKLLEQYQKEEQSPYYNLIHTNTYAILVDKEGKPFNNGRVDAFLYSPPTQYIYNRPNWIFENGKKPYFIKAKEVHLSYPLIVKAYLDTDNLEESIPIDVIEIKNENEISTTAIALFKKGSFILSLVNTAGKTQYIKIGKEL